MQVVLFVYDLILLQTLKFIQAIVYVMNKIFLILIFTSLLILVGDKLLLSYVSAQVTGGLSTNSVNKANVTSLIVGKRSNSTSGGLSTNSVNKANVTDPRKLFLQNQF